MASSENRRKSAASVKFDIPARRTSDVGTAGGGQRKSTLQSIPERRLSNPAPSPYKRKSLLSSVDENAVSNPTNFRESRKSLLKYQRPEASNEPAPRRFSYQQPKRVSISENFPVSRRSLDDDTTSFGGRRPSETPRMSVVSTRRPSFKPQMKRFSLPANMEAANRRRSSIVTSGPGDGVDFKSLMRQTRSLSVGDQPRLGKHSLGEFLPLKKWELEKKLYVQEPSTVPATRMDIETLQEDFDTKLRDQGARETGICPVRRAIYDQCFDEIIREVSINCAERGVLLTRVKDEAKMTMHEFETLYQSSVGYGMRKALSGEQENREVIEEIGYLEMEVDDLKHKLVELGEKREGLEVEERERAEEAERRHREAVEEMRDMNAELKAKLKGVLGAALKF